jgi:hypothetical protein
MGIERRGLRVIAISRSLAINKQVVAVAVDETKTWLKLGKEQGQ